MVDDQVGCPTYTGHLAPALVEIAERGLTGVLHVAGGGRCTWFDLAKATFEETGLDCHVKPQSTADIGRPGAPPRVPRAGRAPAPMRPCSRPGATACRPTWPAWRWRHEAARLRRRRLHRLQLRPHPARPGRRDHRPRQAHVRGPAREPAGPRRPARRRRHRGPRRGRRRASRAARRSSTSPPRRTSTARSPSRTRSSPPTRVGTYTLLEAARERSLRYVQVSTDEVYGSIESGSFTEQSPLQPSSPVQRHQGRRRPARRLLPPHLRARGADLPRLEQLRAVPVPGEADPADGPQRHARRQAAGVRRRHADPQLDLRRGLRARDRDRARARRAGRGLQRRRPGRGPEPRGRQADHRVHGRRRVTDRVRHRPPRPRSPLLTRLREGDAGSAGRRRCASPRGWSAR